MFPPSSRSERAEQYNVFNMWNDTAALIPRPELLEMINAAMN